jgi:Heavy metal associated domain 2
MPDLPEGRVCHLTTGRLRLRIPEKRRDDAFFRTVEQRLAGWDSVDRVEVNPLTASVLVTFSDPAGLFAENALKNDLFTVAYDEPDGAATPPRQALTERVTELWREADSALRRWTGGGADIRSAAFLLMLGGAAYQLLRGRIAPPAATLLWDAGNMLQLWKTALDKSDAKVPEKAAAEG